MTIIEVVFDEKENERKIRLANQRKIRENKESELVEIETDDPEPLKMEHFHLPLGMWMVLVIWIVPSLFSWLEPQPTFL